MASVKRKRSYRAKRPALSVAGATRERLRAEAFRRGVSVGKLVEEMLDIAEREMWLRGE